MFVHSTFHCVPFRPSPSSFCLPPPPQHDLVKVIEQRSDPRHNFQHDLRVYPSSYFREPGYTFQRKYAPWIGASIVGSLEEQSTLKITRQDWDEDAESYFWQTRCF